MLVRWSQNTHFPKNHGKKDGKQILKFPVSHQFFISQPVKTFRLQLDQFPFHRIGTVYLHLDEIYTTAVCRNIQRNIDYTRHGLF